jgi:D-glycero-D-manno-heptose 1,7-bisphosphate phosphatase
MNRIGIFLDRDGTINTEVDYLRSPSDLQLIPGSAQGIREANELGWPVIVITNQSGIARGFFDEAALAAIHTELNIRLAEEDAFIDSIYYCPHHPDTGIPPYRRVCDCRKPAIGMLKAASEAFGIDLAASYLIGDRLIDIETARNAGVTPILVLTGYGRNELSACRETGIPVPHVAEDLYDAIHLVRRLVGEKHVSPDHQSL